MIEDKSALDGSRADRENNPQTANTVRARHTQRLAYLRFDQRDADLLHALQPLVQQHADEIVRAFYEHLIEFETTRDLLRDEAVMTRLVEAQKRYIGEIFGGIYDERYAERRISVGRTHDRIGLEPSWYLGAYHLYQRVLFPLVTDHLLARGATQDEVNDSLLAITKVMTLDTDLALETYFAATSEALRNEKERLEALSDRLQGSNTESTP